MNREDLVKVREAIWSLGMLTVPVKLDDPILFLYDNLLTALEDLEDHVRNTEDS